ncbi:LysR family transcriptional regulator [Leucobacter sp. GX24907]
MKLTSNQLQLLVAVQRTGSLAQAASVLGVTAPAISQQIAKLERSAHATLVERSSKGTLLTPLGAELAEHGRRVLAELGAAEQSLADSTGAYLNRLRVGAPPSLSLRLLPDPVAAARYRDPAANLSVIESGSDEGIGLVLDGELDLALAAFYGDYDVEGDVTLEPLIDEPMVLVLADDHPFAGEAGAPVELARLAGDDWVSGAPGRPLREQLDRVGDEHGFAPEVPFVTESFDVAQSLADVGVAVTLVPATAVDARLSTVVRPTLPALTRRIYAVMPTRLERVPLLPDFLADLRRVARTMIGPDTYSPSTSEEASP